MPHSIHNLKFQIVSGGRLKLDGGAMFGLVPKPLWSRHITPDDRNRIPLDTNCLLIDAAGKRVLIDTGSGGKYTDKQRDILGLEPGEPLVANLARLGLEPEQIDMVILTHLHFDHAGGCTRLEGDKLLPTFPNARHVIHKPEWDDAVGHDPVLKGTYETQHLLPLHEAGLVDFIEGETQLLPGIRTLPTVGHTRGHQAIVMGTGQDKAVYPGDLCPTHHHLPTFWSMGYDQFPLDLRRTKPALLGDAADGNWLVIFDHDSDKPMVRIKRDEKQSFVLSEHQ